MCEECAIAFLYFCTNLKTNHPIRLFCGQCKSLEVLNPSKGHYKHNQFRFSHRSNYAFAEEPLHNVTKQSRVMNSSEIESK